MIYLSTHKNRFVVTIDKAHSSYANIYMIVRSLLSVYELESDRWAIGYDDLLILKGKLDALGLMSGRYIDESAQKLLSKYQSIDDQNKLAKSGGINDVTRGLLDGKLRTTPYEDQWTGISFLLQNPRAGLFDSMGLGKSLESLAYMVALGEKAKKTLVIAPKSVLIGFDKEVRRHTFLNSIVLPSGKSTALKFLKDNKGSSWDILLVHPENLVGAKAPGKGVKSSPYGDLVFELQKINFDLIVIDEFHQYKNIDAKRTQCVLALTERIRNFSGGLPRVVLMTGTPISESPLNAYTALKILSNDYLPHVTRFENYFTIKESMEIFRKDKKTGRTIRREIDKVVGYKNLEELRLRIGRLSIRRTKDDMKGFPEQVFVTRNVILSGKQKDLYKALCGEVASSISSDDLVNLETFFGGNAKTLRLRQFLNHPNFIDEECESAKYQEIDNILSELFEDKDQKVVIWTEYRKGVDLIFDRWNEKYGVIKLYGGVDITESMIQDFEGKDGPRIIAAIPKKAGTGVDFLVRARTAIYIDRPYSFNEFKQSVDRIHRRVKTDGELTWLDKIKSQRATIIFLDVANSIDELVRDRLQRKQILSETVMGGKDKVAEEASMNRMRKLDLLKYLRA